MILEAISGIFQAVSKPIQNIGSVDRIDAQNQGAVVQAALQLKAEQQKKIMLIIGAVVILIVLIIGAIVIIKIKKGK
jgi:hypothetical protein